MADRRHGVRSRARSPPPRARDFSPSRHRGREQYSRRIEKRDNPGRNFSPRAMGVSDYSHRRYSPRRREEYSRRIEKRDTRNRSFSPRALRVSDHSPSRGRRYSPREKEGYSRRIEKRDDFDGSSSHSRHRKYSPGGREEHSRTEKSDYDDRNFRLRALGVSEYDVRDRDVHVGSGRLYGSPRRISSPLRTDTFRYSRFPDYEDAGRVKNKDVVNDGHEMKLHDEGSYREDLSFNKFKWDYRPLDSLQKPEYNRVGERDYYYSHNRYLDSASQYLDSNKGVSFKYEREERMHPRSFTLPVTNLSMADGSSHQFPPVDLNADTNKLRLEKMDGFLHDDQGCFLEKKKDMVGYLEGLLGIGGERVGEEKYSFRDEYSFPSSQDYLKRDSNYTAPSYQPRDYVSGFPGYSNTARDLNVVSHMSHGGSGFAVQPIGFDGYKENMENVLPRVTGGQLIDKSAPRLYVEEREFGSRRIGSTSTRLNDVEEDNRVLHVSRNDVFAHAGDEFFHKKPMKDDRQCDPYSLSPVQTTPDEHKASRLLYGRNQELGSSHLNFGYGPESTLESGRCSLVERSDILQPRGYDPNPLFGRYYESPRNELGLVNLILDEPFERRLRNKHLGDKMMCDQDAEIRISADGNGARKIYKGIEFLDFSKKPKSSKANHEENDRPTSSVFHPSRLSSRDIKKRLGPVPNKLHVSQRLVKKYKPSVKRRLTLAPRQKKRAKLPWIKNLSSNVSSSIQDSYGGPCDYDGDHPPLAKPEPPEKSKDFKQLVQTAFFKFLKQINETPMKRKMYLEQGKAVSLKCMVCGSNSDEFPETETLARHAFSSKKAGLRSQHLGLHKALCRLMGWKIEVDQGSEWVCEVMSDAAASALKEDLIIWPPVLIVYNSTIGIKSPDERVIVSTDELDKKLRDMGFGSIVKVCNGNPANKSVMLVKFNGTLSGLQEAERCHKSYLESKLKQAHVVISADRGEDYFLHGHLGIVEDVDKLDFDTKKRCVIRSKKEILSIVNTPLRESTCS